MHDTDNQSWSSYSRLVLNELERLNTNIEQDSKEIKHLSQKVNLLKQEMGQNKSADKETFADVVADIKDIRNELVLHIKEVNEVWSPKQMQQAKDELYRQKNQLTKMAGIIIAVQVMIGLLMTFGKDILATFY